MGNFGSSLDSLRNWWANATPATRASATGLALFIVAGLFFAAFMGTNPDFQPIFHGVSGKNAAAIETTLREKNINMHFDPDGTVSVPAKDASNAIMYVEAADILDKDTEVDGIGQLDKITMGTSTDVERQRILAAAEGDLANKLGELDPVASAAVTITPGSDTDLFATASPPAAAVILTLKPGETLDGGQVKGIVNLVAHAVSGLTPQNVTLTDQTGTQLYRDNGMGENAIGDGQPLDEGQKYAEVLRHKVQDMLDQTLGPHKSIVTVNAELDFDQRQIHSVEHTPLAGTKLGIPISTSDKTETANGAGATIAAAPAGAGSNLQVAQYAAATNQQGGTPGKYNSETTTTNYDVDSTDTVTTAAPGTVKSLSVAALIDTTVKMDPAGLQKVIAAAIGATPQDTITVQQIAFDTTAAKAAADQLKAVMTQQMVIGLAKPIVAAVVVLWLFWMLLKSSGGSIILGGFGGGMGGGMGGGRRYDEPRLAMVGAGSNIGLLDDVPEASLDSFVPEAPLRVEDVLAEMPEVAPRRRPKRRPIAPSIEEQHDLKMESIQEMISTNAEAVALLLKGWMAEEGKFANRD